MTELNIQEIEKREQEQGLRRPIRVLYVVDSTAPSYANKQLVRLLGQFGRMQLKAAVASIEVYGQAVEKIQGKNVPVVSLEVEKGKREGLGQRLGALLRLRSLIQHNNPQVLHLIGDHARTLGVLGASASANLPVLAETLPETRRGIWGRALDGAGWLFAPRPRFAFLDHDQRMSALKRFGRLKYTSVVGHGIDSAAAVTAPLVDFQELSAGVFDIGMKVPQGQCEAVREMLEAFRIFLGHCPKARLILIGDPQEVNVEPWVSDLGLGEQVVKMPLPQEPGSLLGRLHVLWAHSRDFPEQEIVLQAMAIGLPVIIDHTTGLAQDIREIGGAIMRDGAWPRQFAEATRELMNDPKLKENVGHAGKILVKERHKFKDYAETIRSLYAQMVYGKDV